MMIFDEKEFYNLNYRNMLSYLRHLIAEYEFYYIDYETQKKMVAKFRLGFRPNNMFAYLTSINKELKAKYEDYLKSEDYVKLKKKMTWFIWNSIWFNDNEQMKKEEQDLFDYYGYTEEQYQIYLKYKAKYMPKRQKEYFIKKAIWDKEELERKAKFKKERVYTGFEIDEEKVKAKLEQLHKEIEEMKAAKRGC